MGPAYEMHQTECNGRTRPEEACAYRGREAWHGPLVGDAPTGYAGKTRPEAA